MSCSVHSAPTRKPIRVNGVTIPHAAISREAQNHPSESPAAAWIAAARALALRELLKQETVRLGIVANALSDETGRTETAEEAGMRALLEREASSPTPTEAECRRYYDNNAARFRSPDICEAAHILFVAAPGDEDARDAARVRAQAAIAHLAGRPDDFADLAAELSACPSGKQGGALGQLSGGETVPEFEAALARLQPGETTREPVETRYGFHVIRLARRIEGRQVPFEIARDRIANWLAEKSNRRALADYVAVLAGRADLQGVEFPRPANLM